MDRTPYADRDLALIAKNAPKYAHPQMIPNLVADLRWARALLREIVDGADGTIDARVRAFLDGKK